MQKYFDVVKLLQQKNKDINRQNLQKKSLNNKQLEAK